METYYENAHRRSDLGHAHFRPRFHPAHRRSVQRWPRRQSVGTKLQWLLPRVPSRGVVQDRRLVKFNQLRGEGLNVDRSMHAGMLRSTQHRTRRCIMKPLIAALALATLIAVPTFAQPASAAPVSLASSSFGSNGY